MTPEEKARSIAVDLLARLQLNNAFTGDQDLIIVETSIAAAIREAILVEADLIWPKDKDPYEATDRAAAYALRDAAEAIRNRLQPPSVTDAGDVT